MMARELEGKVAIVTGGGRGLGRAIAESYLAEGASVVLTAAREKDEVEAVAARAANRCLSLLADVTRQEDCERVASETAKRFGGVDVLVNNAGRGMKYVSGAFLTEPTRFWETDPEVWRMVIETNVNGPFYMARAVVPRMMEWGGSIVNVSVNYETMKRKGFSPYGPSKAALESESIIWAQDLEGTGISSYAPEGSAGGPGGGFVYWHVDDVAATMEKLLAMGAEEYLPITPREVGFVTAAVVDPFGNVLGIMYNPHYLDVLGSKGGRETS